MLALQDHDPRQIDAHIMESYGLVMDRLRDGLAGVAAERICTVRYDELVARPLETAGRPRIRPPSTRRNSAGARGGAVAPFAKTIPIVSLSLNGRSLSPKRNLPESAVSETNVPRAARGLEHPPALGEHVAEHPEVLDVRRGHVAFAHHRLVLLAREVRR